VLTISQVRKKVLQRDRMPGVQDFLELEDVSIRVTAVGRAEEADGLGLGVKRNCRLSEPFVLSKNVDHVEGDMGQSRIARRAIGDRMLPDWHYIPKDFEVGVACAKQGGLR
jgi:hypothetical protein